VWLQEFAWTEADLPRKREERASSLPPEAASSAEQLNREPMFCIEVRFAALLLMRCSAADACALHACSLACC
jgi:hypothetical protein